MSPAGPYQLTNTEAEHFQRGQLDVFEVEGAPDCGRLQQIEVRSSLRVAGRRKCCMRGQRKAVCTELSS